MKSETKASQETVLNPSLQRKLRGTVATPAFRFIAKGNPPHQSIPDDAACAPESGNLSREDCCIVSKILRQHCV